MKASKEGGHVPRIVVGQIHLAKAPTVKILIRNENRKVMIKFANNEVD